jgi:hypothetical protein
VFLGTRRISVISSWSATAANEERNWSSILGRSGAGASWRARSHWWTHDLAGLVSKVNEFILAAKVEVRMRSAFRITNERGQGATLRAARLRRLLAADLDDPSL